MDVLFTFTGFHDPYSKGLVDQEEQPGPILSLLNVRSFGHVFLFDTPTTREISRNTKEAINALYPDCEVHILDMKLSDPTSYRDIFGRTETACSCHSGRVWPSQLLYLGRIGYTADACLLGVAGGIRRNSSQDSSCKTATLCDERSPPCKRN